MLDEQKTKKSWERGKGEVNKGVGGTGISGKKRLDPGKILISFVEKGDRWGGAGGK